MTATVQEKPAKRVKRLQPLKKCMGVLKLKLGRCRSAHTHRMLKDLDTLALQCIMARNGAIERWMQWQWQHPDYQPEPITKRDGTLLTRRGVAMMKNRPLPPRLVLPGLGEKSGEMLLYYAAGDAAPLLARKIVSCCSRQAWDNLTTNTPWNHVGEAHYRWQAVRLHEVAIPSFTQVNIPLPNQDTWVYYDGHCSAGSKEAAALCERLHGSKDASPSDSVLRFPLWSKESGRAVKDCIVNLESRQLERREGRQVARPLPAGQKDVLRKIATGAWKLSDSMLVKKDGQWYAHLVYEQPQLKLGLPRDRVATLETLRAGAYHPFSIQVDQTLWKLGRVKMFQAEHERVTIRRSILKDRYKDSAASAVKGHGRKRFYARMLPRTRKLAHHTREFVNKLVDEAVKFCVKYQCGTVLYREPSMKLREKTWFAENELPFDWTQFLSKIREKLHRFDISLMVEVESIQEWKERTKV